MGSETKPVIPHIDLSNENLKPGTRSWMSTCSAVRVALEEYGYFVTVFDKVSPDLHRAIFTASNELFALPPEIKAKTASIRPYFGYIGPAPIIPLYESFGIENAHILDETRDFTNLIWPDGNNYFFNSVYSYSKIVSELDRIVRRMVFDSYNLEKYCESHIRSTTSIFRLSKYRGPDIHETNIGLRAHKDKSFITILAQDRVSGLEIKTRDGEWIALPPSPSSFVVMAGEGFLAWSNGRIYAPLHHVVMNGSKERYSMVHFSFSSGTVEVPEELVDEEHPLQFKPFDHMKLLQLMATEEGRKQECGVKAFYGV